MHVLRVGSSGVTLDGTVLAPQAWNNNVLTWQMPGRGKRSGRLFFTLRPKDGQRMAVGRMQTDTDISGATPNAVGWLISDLCPPRTAAEAVVPRAVAATMATASPVVAAVDGQDRSAISQSAGSYALSVDGDTRTVVHLAISYKGDAVQIDGRDPDKWAFTAKESRLTATTHDKYTYDVVFTTDVTDVTHKLVSGSRTYTGNKRQFLYGDQPRPPVAQWSGQDIAGLTVGIGGALLAIASLAFQRYDAAKQKNDVQQIASEAKQLGQTLDSALDQIRHTLVAMKSAPDADLLRISGELRHLKDNVEDEVARQQLMFEGFADRQRQTGNALADRIAKLEDRLANAQQEPDAVRRDREVTALAKDIEATRRENEAVVERRRNAERSAAEARDRKEAEEKKIEEFEGP